MAPRDREAQAHCTGLIYDVAKAAKEKLDYPTAIARFDSLGDYEDAAAQKTDSIDLYGRQLMREGKYQAACDQFMQIADTGDAIALIRQCRYALGLEKQQAGDYEEAAALFESLGIYEDAQTRGQICRYTAGTNALSAGELEKAAEQLLAAGDYQDAAQKFADVATTLGNAALEAGDNQTAIGWLEQLPESEETQTALNRAVYAYAEQLAADGQKEAAATEFYSLGTYQDAADRGNALEYELAVSERAGDVHSALDRFEALGDYGDAAEQADACRYDIAKEAMEAGELQDALDAFRRWAIRRRGRTGDALPLSDGAAGDGRGRIRRGDCALRGVRRVSGCGGRRHAGAIRQGGCVV
ncbi:MAG: hypothetical protein ACLS7Z_04400 [Christensenellales bacterium]